MNPWNLSPIECATNMALVERGSFKEVAAEMGVGQDAIESRMSKVRRKMGVRHTIQAVLAWDRFVRETGWTAGEHKPEPTKGPARDLLRAQALEFLREHGHATKAEVSRAVSNSEKSVENVLAALHREGAIHLRRIDKRCVWFYGPRPAEARQQVAAAPLRGVSSVFQLGGGAV